MVERGLPMPKMWTTSAIIVVLICLTSLEHVFGYVEAVVGSYVPSTHFQPQVAMMCSSKQKYHNQYMDEAGRWVSDPEEKSVCTKDKLEILDYCRKVYPKRDITNIVEASHYFRIENWCRVGQPKCKTLHLVKPFRCLEGLFQSDALLVPEHCLFDHIHNQSKCLNFDDWNKTASKSCSHRAMQLRSFAMLLPCGIDVFSGVEFVCCPHNKSGKAAAALATKTDDTADKVLDLSRLPVVPPADSDPDDDDEDDADAADDDDDDEDSSDGDSYEDDPEDNNGNNDESLDDVSSQSAASRRNNNNDDEGVDDVPSGIGATAGGAAVATSTPSTVAAPSTTTTTAATTTRQTEMPTATPDYYFSHFDPRREHDEFKAAERRLEDTHREKVTKVMKDWSELEERYQEMKSVDPKGAESFKKKMTARFQKMVSALEEEGTAEKRQLIGLHQQRVMAHINEKKRDAMECYTKALNTNPLKPLKVQKCLERLLRALEKDRTHTINHYKHLLNTNLEQASKERLLTLDHLTDLSRTLNQSVGMLDHYPELSRKVKGEILAFLEDLHSHNEKTPYYLQSKEAENAMLEKYKAEVAAKHEEHYRQKEVQKQQIQQQQLQQQQRRKELKQQEHEEVRVEKQKVEANLGNKLDRKFDPESMEDEALPAQRQDHGAKVVHAQSHSIHHNEAMYSVKREYIPKNRNSSVYVTLSFAGIALLTAIIVGVVFLRRRSSRWPANQGFIEVDQAATPEERHVANMQVNGYENPTYKYFEVRD